MTLSVEKLTAGYKNKRILNELDFQASSGEVVGLVAPNGTGKTTLFRTIANLQGKKSGRIAVNGYQANDRKNFFKELFFLENTQSLSNVLTPLDYLQFIKKTWDSPLSIEEVLLQTGVKSYEKLPVKKMSLGMKQNLLIAIYIMSNASVLLLDEPFNALDIDAAENLCQVIRHLQAEGKTIVISSHSIHYLTKVCTRTAFLKEGKIVLDSQELSEMENQYHEIFKGAIRYA